MARNRSAVASSEAVIGRGARVRGRVGGEGDLVVEGRVEGDVSVSGALSVEAEGAVEGDVTAAAVTIAGGLTGDVSCRGSVLIRAGAQVSGNMGGAEVALEEGAAFSGRIDADFQLPPEIEASFAGGGGGRQGAPRRGRR